MLMDACTAASVQSLSCFLCIEVEFYEKAHLRSVLVTHTNIHTGSCLLYFWQGCYFFLHSVQRYANQIRVFLQILLKFFRMFYHLSSHFLEVVSILGERSFLWDKLTLHCFLKSLVIWYRDPTVLSISQTGGALLETLIRGFSPHGMDTNGLDL